MQTTPLPTRRRLRTRARDALQAVGSARRTRRARRATVLHASTPITGDVLFTVAETTPRAGRCRHRRAHRHLRRGVRRRHPCAARSSPGSANCSSSTRPTSPTLVTLEAGQDHLRGARRSAGDDRHLRVRRRPVAPAVRQDDGLRAAGAPADGDVASARRRRRHHRVQLPRRGVVVEHRDRAGLRRHRGVEALGADAADRAGVPGAARAGRRRRRGAARGPAV